MGKSSRCIGHSACTVNLHPIHRKLKRLCKRMESKQHRLGTLPRKLKKKKKQIKQGKKELTSLMHYSRLCICNALKQKKIIHPVNCHQQSKQGCAEKLLCIYHEIRNCTVRICTRAKCRLDGIIVILSFSCMS